MHQEDTYPRSRSDWYPTRLPLSTRSEPAEAPRAPRALEPAAHTEGPEPSVDETTPVSEIMTRNVFCATPEMNLEALAYILVDQEISGAPVVDEHGKPIGMVSKSDVLREISQDKRGNVPFEARTALDAMTPVVYWLPEDASIAQAAALMAYEHVHRIPIVARSGKITGMVSTLDILRWLARQKGYLIPR